MTDMDETYHSSHGAVQEAKHVFLEHGLNALPSLTTIRIFEMGFGTGLNALLTLEAAEQQNKHIHYTGIEAFPVELEMALKLNYEQYVSSENQHFFTSLHTSEWNSDQPITPFFTINKIEGNIESFLPRKSCIDLIYFDAFGPRAQADMWDMVILEKMASLLAPGGVFVTYCAKGQLKRDLKSIGLRVESLPGPPGKREMTRAWKDL
jgi:tRNA U34 5-methylaminomethyl-2-thiouridine-forming methyltransferase MnmC